MLRSRTQLIIASVGLQGMGALSVVVFNLASVGLLPPEDAGIFLGQLNILILMSMACRFGRDRQYIIIYGKYAARSNPSSLRRYTTSAVIWTLLCASIIVTIVLFRLSSAPKAVDHVSTTAYIAIALPFHAMSILMGAMNQARNRIFYANFLTQSGFPILALSIFLILPGRSLATMSLAVLMSSCLTFALGVTISWRFCALKIPRYRGFDVATAQLRNSVTFLLSDIMNQMVLRGPLLLLTFVGNHSAAAVFNTILTLLRATQTPLAGLNRFSLRYYAMQWFSRQHSLLQETVKRFARIGFILGIATMALILSASGYIAAYLQIDTATLSPLLAIPFAAMACSLFVGPTSQLLVMSGHVQWETLTAGTSAVVGIAITYLAYAVPDALSASYGIGVAILFLNTANFILVRKVMKISSSVI